MRATRTTVSSRPSSRPATIPRWTQRRASAWARPSARSAARAGQNAANHHFAGDIGQAEVRQDDVEIGAGGQVHGLAAATRRNDVHTLATEQERKDFTNVRGVLHEKHPQSVRLPPTPL